MNENEIQLAWSLLSFLRANAQVRSVHKFNVIGRSGKGEFEMWAGRELEKSEKELLIWIWDELKRLRLIAATGTDLVSPDEWVLITDKGKTVTEVELKELLGGQAKAKDAVRLDALMGIPDRGEFDKEFKRLVSDAGDASPLSLVMIDLDHFKSINDRFGHPAGDEVLRRAAGTVSSTVNGKGVAYRYGGEEIVVLLPNHSAAEALAVSERMRVAIENLEIESVDSDITASFGVAAYPEAAGTSEALLEAADDALYQSKGNGRNRVTCAEQASGKVPAKRKARATPATRAEKLNVRVQLEAGAQEGILINVENNTDSQLVVEQIAIEENGIALMEPVRAGANDNWTAEPRLRRHISWRPQSNPAVSLARLHPNEGIQFDAVIELILTIRANDTLYEHRQKIAVKVFATNGQMKQLAG